MPVLSPDPVAIDADQAGDPEARPTYTGAQRPWAAIDVEVESRVETVACRKLSWRESVYNWLIEFNRY